MLIILASTRRVLLRHWPAMLAWFLAGRIVHYVGIEIAGYVGAWTSTAGFLILPLAILARLISFVAMFLVLRDGLRDLQAIAPVPETGAERRRTFLNTLLASILPFFAIYAAWGMLRDDVTAYSARALEVNSGILLQSVVDQVDAPEREIALNLSVNVVTVLIIVLAYSGRWAWKKWATRLPKPFSLVAVYLEAVWVCFSLFLIRDGISALTGWVDTRVGMQWIIGLRSWVSDQLVPIAWIWDGVEWFIGEVAGLVAEPLAWLAIAGVIYGQAIAAEKPWANYRLFTRSSKRMERIPGPARRVLTEIGKDFTGRFTPISNAIALMWRTGPVRIASYVLLYTIVLALSASGLRLIALLIGPQDLFGFWSVADVAFGLLVAAVTEPVRIALVASAYDAALGRADQGSIENLASRGSDSTGDTSTQNGPSASSGTPNATINSYGSTTGSSSVATAQEADSSIE
ncbi:hypothetical protein [Microbacterium sp.]|uniref:hypothetical protein n=1 Tax=Microbacterium sp. TaxID=51671 RepID=UPI003A9185A2